MSTRISLAAVCHLTHPNTVIGAICHLISHLIHVRAHMSDGVRQKVLSKYEGYGLIGGFTVGMLIGLMVGGPHLRDWPVWQSLLTVLGGGALGSLVGYLALSIITGSLAAGPS